MPGDEQKYPAAFRVTNPGEFPRIAAERPWPRSGFAASAPGNLPKTGRYGGKQSRTISAGFPGHATRPRFAVPSLA